ncbi:hypothetical protein GCM10027059_49980 [Myceligenerans halotolerans]
MTSKTTVNETAEDPEVLRAEMVDDLVSNGTVRSPGVEKALRTVPRHTFRGPDDSLADAYKTGRVLHSTSDESGTAVSMISAVDVQAMMLELGLPAGGERVLEIGSGGYNAALLAEMVGPDGQVTTVDIDERVTDRASRYLAEAGYGGVHVVLADADGGVPAYGPFDLIMATTSVADLPPAWVEQLAPGGRIVVPLRLSGTTRVVVLQRDGERLRGGRYELSHFVPMRGVASPEERLLQLAEGVQLLTDADVRADERSLAEALGTSGVVAWAPPVDVERFDGLHMWLLANAPGRFGLMTATAAARDAGVVRHAWGLGMPVILDATGTSLAYLTLDNTDDQLRFGGVGHGPAARELADRFAALVASWDGTSHGAQIDIYPADTPGDQLLSGEHTAVLARPRTRVAISWPATQAPTGA